MALSPIELDYTLQELYNLDGGDAHSLTLPFSESPGTHGSWSTLSSDSFPMRTYAWQPFADTGSTLEMVRNARNCMSQSIAFVAGAMDLRLFEVQQTESKIRCSGLPIPETVIINSILDAEAAYSLRVEDATRMLCAVKLRPLPFVVKVPYSAGDEAVFIIRNKCARKACIEKLEQNLPNYLPTSILVQDFIPGKSFGISLFITNNGRPIFIACTEAPQTEHSTAHVDWPGDFVEFSSQEDLRKRYKAIIEQVGKCVSSQGYTGPLHFDVITTDEGRDFVVGAKKDSSRGLVLNAGFYFLDQSQSSAFCKLHIGSASNSLLAEEWPGVRNSDVLDHSTRKP